MIVDQQSCNDIIQQILVKHEECKGDYDRIAGYFEGGDIWDVSERLWKFCRKNFNYVIEDEEFQFTSCPYTMLTGGDVDCKNYSLFIGGVLDALRRRGYRCHWQFRFTSYALLDPTPGHVFVVVNPTSDDIWIDPVLDQFNRHLFYWYHRNRNPRKTLQTLGAIGFVSRPSTVGSTAEDSLLQQVKDYSDGLSQAITLGQQTGSFNSITKGILQSASKSIPGIGQALQVVNSLSVAVNDKFGAGSPAAKALSGSLYGGIVGLFVGLFSGRTFNSDQYWAGVYYKFYVLGQNVTDPNRIADSDVIPALKWFVDRTGVFISGREHIIALTQSPGAYTNYYKVNADTTTDATRVTAAYNVASRYWQSPGNFNASLLGSWAGTIGVFDNGLVQLAAKLGMTPEQYVAATGTADQVAAQYTDAATSTSLIPGIPNIAAAGIAALLIFLSLSKN